MKFKEKITVNKYLYFACFLLLIACQSCLTLEEKVDFYTPTSGRMTLQFGFFEGIENLDGALGSKKDSTASTGNTISNEIDKTDDSFISKVKKSLYKYSIECAKIDGISEIKIDTTELRYRIGMDFENINALNLSMNKFIVIADDIFDFDDTLKGSKPQEIIKFYKVGNQMTYRSTESLLSFLIDSKKIKESSLSMGDVLMKDSKYTVTLNFPEKISSVKNKHSKILYDFKGVSWEIGLLDVFRQKSDMSNEIYY